MEEKKIEIEEKKVEEENKEEKKSNVSNDEMLEALAKEAAESVEELEKEKRKRKKGEDELKKCREEVEKLKKEVERLSREKEELNDKLLRIAADFDNYRKRVEKEKEEIFNYGHANIVKDILLVVDNLERAIEAAENHHDHESLLEGVKLTLNSFWSTLKKYGVEPLEAEGKPFDPKFHEAMTTVETDEVEPNTVVKEFQRGYLLKDRLLRPSRVAVSVLPQKPQESNEQPESEGGEKEEGKE